MYTSTNLYAVTVTIRDGGATRTMWVKGRDEAEAIQKAEDQMFYGGRVADIRWIRREP